MEPVTLTLQINHHHLLFVLELAEVLGFFLFLCQLGGHLTNPVLQQLFLLLGKIAVWVRVGGLKTRRYYMDVKL